MCNSDFNNCPNGPNVGDPTASPENGDYVDDTPRDPLLSLNSVNNNCIWDSTEDNCDNTGTYGPYNPLIDNFMAYSRVTCRSNFTNGQIDRMFALMPSEIIYSEIDEPCCNIDVCVACTNAEEEIIEINQSTTINIDRVHGSLVINSGTAIINSRIEFSPNSKLVVKNGARLIIDNGGILTKCNNPLIDSWKGVQLGANIDNTTPGNFGINPAYLEIKNGGIIEFAEIGVSNQIEIYSSVGSGPLSGTQTSYSSVGQINMTSNLTNKSEIRNCEIGILFGPRGLSTSSNPALETSFFDEALFRNNQIGIKLKRSHGLELSNNSFVDNETGILAVNSSLSVDNNLFSNAIGITIEGVTPSFYGIDVINNQFHDANAVYINGAGNGDEINIHNNQIFSEAWGIITDGLTDFSVLNNDFYDTYYGTTFENTGDFQLNMVEENAFYANFRANQASWANDIEFRTNCFDNSSLADIKIPNGKIHLEQGSQQFAASNCFSNYFDLGHHKIVTGANADFFTYFTKDGYQNPQSCKYPDPFEDESNFEVSDSDEELVEECGTGINIFGAIPPHYRDCIIPGNNAERGQMIDFLTAEIERIENDLPDDDGNIATGYFKKWLLAKYKRCLDRIRKIITGDIIRGNDPDEAVRFLEEQGDPRSLMMAFGLLIDMEDYDAARVLLNIIPNGDTEASTFVQIQSIYLNYLSNSDSFVLEDSDRQFIHSTGNSIGILSGFARAIYYDLTGIRILKDYGETGHSTTNRNAINKSKISKNELKVFPNPNSTDLLNISLETDNTNENPISFRLYDMTGNSVLTGILESTSTNIDISSLSNSVYFIEISTLNGQWISKFVKL